MSRLIAFRRNMEKWRWIPLKVLGLSLVSIMILTWARAINEKERTNYAVTRALMEMQVKATSFHLWLEEEIQGDKSMALQNIWEDLDEAIRLSVLLLRGGKVEPDLDLGPLEGSGKRAKVEEIRSLLTEFKMLALERHGRPDEAGIGTPLDLVFDETFRKFEEKVELLEHSVQADQLGEQAAGRRAYSTILIVWSFVVALATMGLWSREARRKAAELALQTANDKLSSQAEELKVHRGHLMELVGERTAELTASNKVLETEIVERMRVAKELEESKSTFEKLSLEFRTLLDAIPDSLILISPEMEILWTNKSAAALFGETARDLAGLQCWELSVNRLVCRPECPGVRAFRSGRAESSQVPASDGTVWDIRAFPVKDGMGQVLNVIVLAADITEKVMLQAEALRVAHLASLGELAAGIAHEINNPINGIINYAQVLMDEWHGPEEDGDLPEQIIKEGERIASIVGGLLAFAREGRVQKHSIHVHQILSETLRLVGRQLESEGIILKTNVPEDLPAISANLQLMQQVFLNIVSNARHALNQKYPGADAGKVLDVRAEEATVQGCRSVVITFHDRGVGISAAVIDKVKEPFFTTKPEGLGTGLGLSISHGIVTDHGGKLLLRSEDGEYTRVQIVLPLEVSNEAKNSRG